MSEEKTYIYNLRCSNCAGTVQIKIPFGIPASEFITESKLIPCIHCGCNPLTAKQMGTNK